MASDAPTALATRALADLGSSIDGFFDALERFGEGLASLAWGPLVLALAFWAGMLVLRAHAWANGLRAAYSRRAVSERRVVAAFLVGAGFNGVLPARAGDALKIFLAKRSVRGSSYPALASSYAVLAPFDTAIGLLVLIYAISQGLLPELPRLPSLPAFEIAFWAQNPRLLLFFVTCLGVAAVALYAVLARHVTALWQRLAQGVAVLRAPRRYLSDVAAWQLAGWLCRFASYWFFLDAFHIGGSAQNVLLVMSVESISKALPLTPGGAGAQQALLVATLSAASYAAVLSYSVGQQIAVTALALALGLLALIVVFGTRDWRGLMRQAEAEAQRAAGERAAIPERPAVSGPGG